MTVRLWNWRKLFDHLWLLPACCQGIVVCEAYLKIQTLVTVYNSFASDSTCLRALPLRLFLVEACLHGVGAYRRHMPCHVAPYAVLASFRELSLNPKP